MRLRLRIKQLHNDLFMSVIQKTAFQLLGMDEEFKLRDMKLS